MVFRAAHKTLQEKFWENTVTGNGCWEWTGPLHSEGYGQIRYGSRGAGHMYAHRFSYKSFVDDIPTGHYVTQVCQNRRCVNPAHLEAITISETRKRQSWTDQQRKERLMQLASSLGHVQIPHPANDPFPNIKERFWDRITKTDECWDWTGGMTTAGYGLVEFNRQKWFVHRLVYHLLVGPIPEGRQIDHTCQNRHCVNPAHMRVLTIEEHGSISSNQRININGQPRLTHCSKGHPFDEANTYVNPSTGVRQCRTCRREFWKTYKRKK